MKVYVTIDPKTSNRTYEIEGVGGVACEDVTRAIIEANEVEEFQHTAEAFDEEALPEFISEE